MSTERLIENEFPFATRQAYINAFRELGNFPPARSFDRLHRAYSGQQRYYHNWHHVDMGIEHVVKVAPKLHEPAAVTVAFFYHDAVNTIGAEDNEEQSARRADEDMKLARIAVAKRDTVRQLILVTKHDRTPASSDESFMIDIDLAIFGQPEEIFWGYEANIRKEYENVAWDRYALKRAEILSGFLERGIYNTSEFQSMYGGRARVNLIEAIAKLRL